MLTSLYLTIKLLVFGLINFIIIEGKIFRVKIFYSLEFIWNLKIFLDLKQLENLRI